MAPLVEPVEDWLLGIASLYRNFSILNPVEKIIEARGRVLGLSLLDDLTAFILYSGVTKALMDVNTDVPIQDL